MPAGTSLGKLFVELLLNDTDFRKKLGETENKLGGTGAKLKGFGDSVSTYVTSALVGASAAIAGLVTASAVVGAAFEQQINKVNVLSGNKPGGLEKLAATAREFGAATTFSASEAAGAMESLAQAGFEVGQIISGTDSALALAAASGGELATATSLVATTMSQFQLSAADSTRIADVFTQALNTSQLDMEGLQVAMSYAGTTGASLGQTLEQTTAAVAMFSNLGLEGSKAGTAFRSSMAQMITVSEDGEKILGKLGITTKDISPELHNFGEILQTLGEHGITATDAINVFGAEVGGNLAALAQQAVATGTSFDKTYEGIVTSLENSAGKAADTSKLMLDNVSGAFEQASGAFEEFLLTLFDQYAGPLKALLDEVGNVINAVTANFRRNGQAVGGFFDTTLGGLTAWLRINESYIASLAVTWAERFTKIATVIGSLIPYLDEIALLMGAIFVVTQIVAFVNVLGSAYTAIVTVQTALAALGVELSVMTVGVYAAVVAIGAIVAALAAYAIGNSEAEASAQRLTDAQTKQALLNDETFKNEAAAMEARLADIKASARQELSISAGLSRARADELKQIIALDAAGAVLAVRAGKLVDVNGELRTATSLVTEAQDYSPVDKLAGATATLAAKQADLTERQNKLKEAMHAFEPALKKGLYFQDQMAAAFENLSGEAGLNNLEAAQLRLEQLNAEVASTAKAQENLANETALAQRALLDEGAAGVQATADQGKAVTAFSKTARREESAADKERQAARDAAAKANKELMDQELRDLAATLQSEGEKLKTKRAEELADTQAKFDEETALWGDNLRKRYEIAVQAGVTLAAMQGRFRAEDLALEREAATKAAQVVADATQDAADRANAIWMASWPLRVQLTIERNQALANLERDLQAKLADIDNLSAADRDAALAKFAQQSADDKLAIQRDYDKRIEQAREDELTQAKALPSRLVQAWRTALDDLESDIPDTFEVAFARTTREVVQFVKAVGAGFNAIKSAAGSVIGAVQGITEKISGFAFSINDVVGAVEEAQAAAAETGGSVDMAQVASDFVTGLFEQADTIINIMVAAVPPALEALAAGLPGLLQTVADSIPVLVLAFTDALPDIVQAIVDALPAIFTAVVEGLVSIVQTVAAMLPDIVADLMAMLPGMITTLAAAIGDIIIAVAGALPGIIQALVDGLPAVITAVIDAIPVIVMALVAAIPHIITSLLEAIPTIIGAVLAAIPQLITMIIGMVPDIIISFAQGLPELLPAIVALIPRIFTEIVLAIPQVAVALVMAIFTELLPRIPEIALSLIQGLLEGLWNALKDIGKFILEAFKDAIAAIGDAINPFNDNPSDKKNFGDVINPFNDKGEGQGFLGIKGLLGGGAHSGVEYVPATMRMTVHKGEAVVPADRNAARMGGAAPAPAGMAQNFPSMTGAGSGPPLEVSVLVDGKVIDAVMVEAMGRGKAPKLQRTMRAMTGTQLNFSRGRFNPWS